MPKVMLVEDDNNLREIYDARLAAEGYEIVSAHDGEEALALAVKEKPDLIISDVMMPKISGFDMLDILRSTPETKNTKVIMMTALGQAEDRQRADKLGADRYLVKSQVTLEDVIKVAHEVLNDTAPAPATDTPAPPATPTVTADVPVVAAPPVEPPAAPEPVAAPAEPATPVEPPAIAEPPATPDPTPTPAPTPEPVVEPSPAPEPPAPPAPPVVETPPSVPDEPITVTPPTAPFEEPTATAPPVPDAPDTPAIAPELAQTKTEESNGVEKQIQDYIANNPTLTSSADGEKPADAAPATSPVTIPVSQPDEEVAPEPTTAPETPAAATPSVEEQLANPSLTENNPAKPEPPSHKKLVLTPTDTALAPAVDLNALLAKEEAKETSDEPVGTHPANTIIAPAQEPEETTPTVAPNDISL